jgi:cob(I)alamin adenosyltransferase
MRIDRVVTRGGDGGETSLGDGARVAKNSARIEAIGVVDEANAVLGVLRLHLAGDEDAIIGRVQNDLFDLGADLAVPIVPQGGEGGERLRLTEAPSRRLEAELEELNRDLPALTSFVLPGGTPGAAHAHLARTIVRRAERAVVHLGAEETINPELQRYLNRLSDLLFVLARQLNVGGQLDVQWEPGANR